MSKNYGYFKQQACDFSVEALSMLKMTSFYINQAYQGYKESKKNILLRSIHPRPSDTNAQSSREFKELRTIVE